MSLPLSGKSPSFLPTPNSTAPSPTLTSITDPSLSAPSTPTLTSSATTATPATAATATPSPSLTPSQLQTPSTANSAPVNPNSYKDNDGHCRFVHDGEVVEIRNVWSANLEQEFALIRDLITRYPVISMDTEFPGVVARPVNNSYSPDYQYQSLKCNVDLLRLIQIGISFADEDGNFAKNTPCFQFNFKFDLKADMFAQDSIDLLLGSGICFQDHEERGIDPFKFGELIMSSGLVLDDRVTWICYHGGYDFGYLLKLLTCQNLPSEEKDFFELLWKYFPVVYDIKYMTSLLDGFFGGLQKAADDLGVKRIGPEHQAGSDSLLTMSTYFELAKKKFSGDKKDEKKDKDKDDKKEKRDEIDTSKYKNELFGYGTNQTTVRKRGGGEEK